MSNNKHSGMFGKGYYIALVLCAAAIGLAGFGYYRNANRAETGAQEPVSDVAAAVEQEDDVAALATQPGQQGTENTIAPTEKKSLKTGAPVAGQTVVDYAMDCLSYNETTRDWRTHNGIDIAAEPGAAVMAAADGVVYTVFEDDTMGTTVVIRHDGGYTTQYASLDPELQVSVGDTVTLGQTIGCVGQSALLETAIGPHVHFAVTCNDEPVNPADFLVMN